MCVPLPLKAFAAKMKDHFILHGPQEGRSSRSNAVSNAVPNENPNPVALTRITERYSDDIVGQLTNDTNDFTTDINQHGAEHAALTPVNRDTPKHPDNLNLPLLAQQNLGIDIVSEFRGKYSNDPMFRAILDKPNEV